MSNNVTEVYIADVAKQQGMASLRILRDRCRAGKIPGAIQEREGGMWKIPISSVQPHCERRGRGRPPKKQAENQ